MIGKSVQIAKIATGGIKGSAPNTPTERKCSLTSASEGAVGLNPSAQSVAQEVVETR